jgi:hypothetical protein
MTCGTRPCTALVGWTNFFSTQSTPCPDPDDVDACLGTQTVMVTLTADQIQDDYFEATIR